MADDNKIETVDTHDLPLPPPGRHEKQQSLPPAGRWDWLKFWGKPPQTADIPTVDDSPQEVEDTELKERDERIKAVMDELMLNPAVGHEFYNSRYSYFVLKAHEHDMPLEKWNKDELRAWKTRQNQNRDLNHTIREIPVTQDGQKGVLKVEVYPVDLIPSLQPKDKGWSYGHVELNLPDHPGGLHKLSYLRSQVGVPENGWFKGGKMKDVMLKTLNGLRDTTAEEKEKRKVDQTTLTKQEAVEEWEKWLPAVQELVDSSKIQQPAA